MVLEIAQAFASMKPPPRARRCSCGLPPRRGLLGSKYYARAPLYPLNKTLANINIDAMYPWGTTRDMIVIGSGNTTLEDILAEEASADGRSSRRHGA